MIDLLSANDKFLRFQAKRVLDNLNTNQRVIYEKINSYLDKYIKFSGYENDDISVIYKNFIKDYTDDCKKFLKTGLYPIELNTNQRVQKREDYDLVLIISCLLTNHRFKIIEEIMSFNHYGDHSLFIGVGSGLEIYLLEGKIKNFSAYDISISNFAKTKFNKYIYEELYEFKEERQYNDIFAIELLEHIKNPYDFLNELFKSLIEGGMLHCTTAKNIPQFDHLYNFIDNEEFIRNVKKIGFNIEYYCEIKHIGFDSKLNSNNIFYRLIK